jgi:peptidoglycan/LPS O-acetylase OafA/YrhL
LRCKPDQPGETACLARLATIENRGARLLKNFKNGGCFLAKRVEDRKYYESLDGLRAICIALTLIAHTPGNPGINGSIGVDIFFALSGYLITMLLMREHDETGRVCILCFYIRRLFRIVPLYALTIFFYFISTLLACKFLGDVKGFADFFSALPWLVTFTSELRPLTAGRLFGHAWTLGIEEKYYLVWPAFFGFFRKENRWLILSPPLFLATLLIFDQEGVRGYFGILFGSVLALSSEREGPLAFYMSRLSPHLWAALMLVGYLIASSKGLKYNLLVSIPAACLIFTLINHKKNVYRSALSRPFLVYLGGLTYGIYLIHPLVQHITDLVLKRAGIANFVTLFAAMYVGSVFAAIALQKWVESPLIKIGRRYAVLSSARQRKEAAP